jgi:hypothetical protein
LATVAFTVAATSGQLPSVTASALLTSVISGDYDGDSYGWVTPTIPLTTVFTPPPSCSTRPLTVLGLEGGDRSHDDHTAYRDAGFMFGQYTDTAGLSCYPSGFATVVYSTVATFSPGICPSDYITVVTRQYNSTVAYQTTLTYNVTYPPYISLVPHTTLVTEVTEEYSTVAGATVTAATCCLS